MVTVNPIWRQVDANLLKSAIQSVHISRGWNEQKYAVTDDCVACSGLHVNVKDLQYRFRRFPQAKHRRKLNKLFPRDHYIYAVRQTPPCHEPLYETARSEVCAGCLHATPRAMRPPACSPQNAANITKMHTMPHLSFYGRGEHPAPARTATESAPARAYSCVSTAPPMNLPPTKTRGTVAAPVRSLKTSTTTRARAGGSAWSSSTTTGGAASAQPVARTRAVSADRIRFATSQ
jgi:hypothetical protein